MSLVHEVGANQFPPKHIITAYEWMALCMQKLSGSRGYYQTRAHIPMLGDAVCVGFTENNPKVTWDQTAQLYVAEHDTEYEIGVTDIRKDDTGQRISTGLIRFQGNVVHYRLQKKYDGFLATLPEDSASKLAGMIEGQDVPLPEVNRQDAASFVMACTFALDARAKNMG